MQTTAARAEVNRANAAHSTGPRTEEGKAASSKNALRHGLTSSQLLVLPEEQPEFDALLKDLTRDLMPEGAMETILFNDIVHAAWQKRRARLLEAQACGSLDQFPLLDRLRRYHNHYDRLFKGALKSLLEIQRERVDTAIEVNQPASGHLIPLKLLRPPQTKARASRAATGQSIEDELFELDLASFRTARPGAAPTAEKTVANPRD
ncbi:MAG: hypothetical protein FJW40_25055 [Acidobacteria bacterium]|nr:hypothetical protein [Acidobacteriota bacterium]